MNAQGIIKCIRETDDITAVKLLEDIFMYGFFKGINRGYDTSIKLMKDEVIINSDIGEARKIFIHKYT